MGLHHGCAVIDVDDKPGESVALAVNKAEGIGDAPLLSSPKGEGTFLLLPLGEDALACLVGCAEALFPEGAVNGDVLKREHTHGDAAYLYVSYGEEAPIGTDYAHYVALFGASVDMMNGSGEYPRVKTSERLFFSFL